MSTSASPRTELKFATLAEVIERLEALQRNGYTSLGKWNLAQVCEHLSDWACYMLDGYPKVPFPISLMLWGMKITTGRSMLRKIINTGKMAAGGPTIGQTVHPAAGLDDARSLQRFKETAERFEAHLGAFHPSPLFGELSAKDGLALHLVHCAHHVSFLAPTA